MDENLLDQSDSEWRVIHSTEICGNSVWGSRNEGSFTSCNGPFRVQNDHRSFGLHDQPTSTVI
jgi:hypothetical protein